MSGTLLKTFERDPTNYDQQIAVCRFHLIASSLIAASSQLSYILVIFHSTLMQNRLLKFINRNRVYAAELCFLYPWTGRLYRSNKNLCAYKLDSCTLMIMNFRFCCARRLCTRIAERAEEKDDDDHFIISLCDQIKGNLIHKEA